jgi:hypothetical protein
VFSVPAVDPFRRPRESYLVLTKEKTIDGYRSISAARYTFRFKNKQQTQDGRKGVAFSSRCLRLGLVPFSRFVLVPVQNSLAGIQRNPNKRFSKICSLVDWFFEKTADASDGVQTKGRECVE